MRTVSLERGQVHNQHEDFKIMLLDDGKLMHIIYTISLRRPHLMLIDDWLRGFGFDIDRVESINYESVKKE